MEDIHMSARNMAKRTAAGTLALASALSMPTSRSDYYAVHAELDRRLPNDLDSDVADALLDSLASFSPAIGSSERGWMSFRISVPAASLPAAVQTACALVIDATRAVGIEAGITAVEAMTEAEFDVREGWRTEPAEEAEHAQVLSTAEAAALLKVTPARVRQLVADGSLSGHRLGERSWSFDRAVVERLAYSRA